MDAESPDTPESATDRAGASVQQRGGRVAGDARAGSALRAPRGDHLARRGELALDVGVEGVLRDAPQVPRPDLDGGQVPGQDE